MFVDIKCVLVLRISYKLVIFEKNLGDGYYWTKAPVLDMYFHVRAE
jgi:hypothetical protein